MSNSTLTPRINALEDPAGGPILATPAQSGGVSTVSQTFAGEKTFNNGIVHHNSSSKYKTFFITSGASSASIDIASVFCGSTGSDCVAISFYITSGCGQSGNVGSALSHAIIGVTGTSGPTFGTQVMVTTALTGVLPTVSLSWSGSGSTRTLVATLNQVYSSSAWHCQTTWRGNASVTFL